jgi:monoamine oxidase
MIEEGMEVERALFEIGSAVRRIRFGWPLDAQPLKDLDVSFSDFLARLELSRALYDLVVAWAALYLGCPPDEASAVHVLSMLAGFDASAYSLFYVLSEKFGGGTVGLIEAIAGDGSAQIELGAAVRRVEQREDEVVVTAAGNEYTASTVVLATPLNTWNSIEFDPPLSQGKRELASQGQPGRSTKIWALLENVPENVLAVGWGTGELSWISSEFRVDGANLVVGFGVSPERFDVSNPEHIETAIHAFLPEARVVATDAHDWVRDEFSRGTWIAYRPGWATGAASALRQAEGRLVFAGSDTAIAWPGWIEGAIESGYRAAKEAALFTNRRGSLAAAADPAS